MNFRFLLLFSVIGLLSVFRVSATAQVSDILIINGESFMLFACPLGSHPVGFTTEMLFGETDLSQLFPGKYHNRKVFADWMMEGLLSPRGEMLFYVNSEFSSSWFSLKEVNYHESRTLSLYSFRWKTKKNIRKPL